jgi:hypothetical protein
MFAKENFGRLAGIEWLRLTEARYGARVCDRQHAGMSTSRK